MTLRLREVAIVNMESILEAGEWDVASDQGNEIQLSQ
jgi:hypothetical protein